MLRSSIILTLVGAGVLISSSIAGADGQDQYYIKQAEQRYFFPNELQNARTFGMAGAAAVTSQDSSSVVTNPAGLGLTRIGEFTGTYGYNEITGNEHPSWEDIEGKQNFGQGLFAFPLGPVADDLPDYGNLGFGWSGLRSDTDDSIDSDAYVTAVHGAYAKALNPDLSLGYALSWFHNRLQSDLFDYNMTNGFRHTIGAQQKVDEDTTIGAQFFYGHGDYDLDLKSAAGQSIGDSDSTVRSHGFDVGGAWTMGQTTLFLSMDYTVLETNGDLDSGNAAVVVGGDESGTFFTPKAGIEYAVNDMVQLRGGYRYISRQAYHFDREELKDMNGAAKSNAFSLGVGLFLPIRHSHIIGVRADYGVEYRNVQDDWEHRVTLAVPFDLCERTPT